ncbi:hypothetical protein CHUAL_009829 [Chamberlinius hualienensis]
MTISYQHDVSNGFNGFSKLLVKWKGSVYNLVYKELAIYLMAYFAIRAVYKFLLDSEQQVMFEMISLHCSRYIDLIPLVFVLGFYVTFVAQRWWTQFTTIPFPDSMMNAVNMYIDGSDDRGRMIRRTLMRYWNSSFVMMMITVSTAVQKRFPTLDSLVKAGYMTEDELQIFTSFQINANKFWFPMNWFIRLLNQARLEGRTRDEIALRHILQELNDFRGKLRLLWCHDWVTLPLVYTQVVTLACYCFFAISLISRQYLSPDKNYPGHEVDFYVPVFAILQFLFYMGWLKVAEQLINPFGEDDDDIECNWLIDRHLQVSYIGVDDLSLPEKVPICCKDPSDLPENFNDITILVGDTSNELQQSVVIQPNPSVDPMSKKWWNTFCRCCGRSSGPEDENLLTKRPQMLGKRDLLLSIESIAKINAGRWKFEVESVREQDKARSMDCIIQLEPNNVDSTEVQLWREQMTNNRWGSLPLKQSYRRTSTFDYRFSLPPSQRRRRPTIELSGRRLAALKTLSINHSRLDRVGIEEETSTANVISFQNIKTLSPHDANNLRGSCHLQSQHSSF